MWLWLEHFLWSPVEGPAFVRTHENESRVLSGQSHYFTSCFISPTKVVFHTKPRFKFNFPSAPGIEWREVNIANFLHVWPYLNDNVMNSYKNLTEHVHVKFTQICLPVVTSLHLGSRKAQTYSVLFLTGISKATKLLSLLVTAAHKLWYNAFLMIHCHQYYSD